MLSRGGHLLGVPGRLDPFQGVVQNLATVEASAAVTLGTGLRLVPNGGADHFDGVSCLLRLAFKD